MLLLRQTLRRIGVERGVGVAGERTGGRRGQLLANRISDRRRSLLGQLRGEQLGRLGQFATAEQRRSHGTLRRFAVSQQLLALAKGLLGTPLAELHRRTQAHGLGAAVEPFPEMGRPVVPIGSSRQRDEFGRHIRSAIFQPGEQLRADVQVAGIEGPISTECRRMASQRRRLPGNCG